MSARASQPSATITIHVPLKFQMRGGRKAIIGQVPQPNRTVARTRPENAVIKTIARAYRWRTEIENGRYSSITDLAKSKGVNQSYACRVLRLTLIGPDIVEAILDRRGANLMLGALMRPLPTNWLEQSEALTSHSVIGSTGS